MNDRSYLYFFVLFYIILESGANILLNTSMVTPMKNVSNFLYYVFAGIGFRKFWIYKITLERTTTQKRLCIKLVFYIKYLVEFLMKLPESRVLFIFLTGFFSYHCNFLFCVCSFIHLYSHVCFCLVSFHFGLSFFFFFSILSLMLK